MGFHRVRPWRTGFRLLPYRFAIRFSDFKIRQCSCWCSNTTLCSNFFPKVSGDSDNEFRHSPASAPEHAGRVFLHFCCPAPPSSPSLPILVLFARDFLFRNGRLGFGRVSPKGETDGIQTTVLTTFSGNSDIPFRLGHSFGLGVVYHLWLCNDAQNGICPRLQNSNGSFGGN